MLWKKPKRLSFPIWLSLATENQEPKLRSKGETRPRPSSQDPNPGLLTTMLFPAKTHSLTFQSRASNTEVRSSLWFPFTSGVSCRKQSLGDTELIHICRGSRIYGDMDSCTICVTRHATENVPSSVVRPCLLAQERNGFHSPISWLRAAQLIDVGLWCE